jgi:TnpA family transposase
MTSADGMRFVIPVSTIHAAYNPRYFGRQRGSTLYSWMADTHIVFAQTAPNATASTPSTGCSRTRP